MGVSYFCPNAMKKNRNDMLICRLDRCLCGKQQYCPAKRMYENTAGIGNCEKRKDAENKQKNADSPQKGEENNGANA